MCHGSVTYCARIMEIERRETEDGWNAFNRKTLPPMIVMSSHFSHLKSFPSGLRSRPNLDQILSLPPVLPPEVIVRLLPLRCRRVAEQTVRREARPPVCIRAANKAVDQTGLNGGRRRAKEGREESSAPNIHTIRPTAIFLVSCHNESQQGSRRLRCEHTHLSE